MSVPEPQILRLGRIDYEQAWARQRAVHEERVAGTRPDTVLLLEHPPVYTAGKRTLDVERPHDGTPVVDVDRGGKITWHGPGQLVGYPIAMLAEPFDVVRYVRALEGVLIETCGALGLPTGRVDGRSGVWLTGNGPDRKIAAIGIRVSRGVTMHGFALNADPDLSAYGRIIPCGIPDAGVTSLTQELGRRVGVEDVIDDVTARLRTMLTTDPLFAAVGAEVATARS